MASYDFSDRREKIRNEESAKSSELKIEMSKRTTNQISLDLSFSYVDVEYVGAPNSPIEYDLLEGLKNGNNYIWRTNFTKRLSNSIDLNINYEGRKTGVSQIIHVARAQVKASF